MVLLAELAAVAEAEPERVRELLVVVATGVVGVVADVDSACVDVVSLLPSSCRGRATRATAE